MRDRRADILERPLGPESLVGSWFNHYEGGELESQGLVVAEIQPGAYMLEVDTGGVREQRVIALMHILEAREEWRFYDNDDWMRGNAAIEGGDG